MTSLHPETVRHILTFMNDTFVSRNKMKVVCSHWNICLSDEAFSIDFGVTSFDTIGGFRQHAEKIQYLFGEKCKQIIWNHDMCDTPIFFNFVPSQLIYLDLSWCPRVTDYAFVKMIQNCPKLKKIILQGCRRLGNYCIEEIANKCSELEYLDVSNGVFATDESICEIGRKCKNLVYLNVGKENYYITDKSMMTCFTHCPRLRCFIWRHRENV